MSLLIPNMKRKSGFKFFSLQDHAGGSLLITEAGGAVCDVFGKKLDFSVGRTMKMNKGIVATSLKLSEEVMNGVKCVLGDRSV